METRTVAVTADDDKALQAAQAAAMDLVEAARTWASRTLEVVKAPLALVVEISEVPNRAAVLAAELAKLTPERTTKAGQDGPFLDAVDALVQALQALRPVLVRIEAPQAEAVAVATGWLLSLQDLVDRAEEARAETTKAVPGGGVHAHSLDVDQDGDHVHLLRLSSGELVLTGRDGAHSHNMNHLAAGVPGGAHGHTFRLPDGRELAVAPGGPHLHEVEGETETTHGGVHVHEVEVDGEALSTLLPETAVDKAREELFKLRGLWGSPAGKTKIAAYIKGRLPADVHTYVEPFAGGAAVFFSREEPSPVEVLADAHPLVAGAFKFVRDATEEDIKRLEEMDWSGSVRQATKVLEMEPRDEVERFYRFAYRRWASFFRQGEAPDLHYDRTVDGKAATLMARFRGVQERLQGVHIREADYKAVVQEFDGPDTFYYLDPPYEGFTQQVGEEGFSTEELVKVLQGVKGRFLLHYGADREEDFLGHGWTVRVLETSRTPGGAAGGRDGTKLLEVLNYSPDPQADTGKVAKAADRPHGAVLPVVKSDRPEEERYILGVVLEPNDGGPGVPLAPDTQGDVYSAEEIRQAAHLFMEHYRNLGHQHRELVTGGKLRILESYVAMVDMVVLPDGRAVGVPNLLDVIRTGEIEIPPEAQLIYRGTWLLGMRVVDDDLWEDFKAGRITGLSIGGSARRVQEAAPAGVSPDPT